MTTLANRAQHVNRYLRARPSTAVPGRGARLIHLRGATTKEQRQYEHIKESAEKSGRYGDRAAEVAARTVMKQHKTKGHKKGQ